MWCSLWLLVSEGLQAALKAPASVKGAMLESLKVEFQRASRRKRDALKRRGETQQTPYIQAFPASPSVLRTSHPELYARVFQESPPIPCKVSQTMLAQLDVSYNCRNNGSSSKKEVLTLALSEPSQPTENFGQQFTSVANMMLRMMNSQQKMLEGMFGGQAQGAPACLQNLASGPRSRSLSALANGTPIRRLPTLDICQAHSSSAASSELALLSSGLLAADTPIEAEPEAYLTSAPCLQAAPDQAGLELDVVDNTSVFSLLNLLDNRDSEKKKAKALSTTPAAKQSKSR